MPKLVKCRVVRLFRGHSLAYETSLQEFVLIEILVVYTPLAPTQPFNLCNVKGFVSGVIGTYMPQMLNNRGNAFWIRYPDGT